MSTVLWGARRGDVIYGSRDWRRRNIPIGDTEIEVDSPAFFDVGNVVEVSGDGAVFTVTGMEGRRLGVAR